MRQKRIYTFLLVILFINISQIPADNKSLRGKIGYPFLDKTGAPDMICNDFSGRLRTLKTFLQPKDIIPDNPFSQGWDITSLQIKKDINHQIWMIWEQEINLENNIFIGKITDTNIHIIKNLSRKFPGENFSPMLTITPENQKWVCWVNQNEEGNFIIIQNLTTGMTWSFDPDSKFPIFSPKLISNGRGSIWLFWVGQGEGRDRIFYSCLDSSIWSKASILSAIPAAPQFHPTVAMDYWGNPWIAWSTYDGQDYEIYVSSWNGKEWIVPEKITENEGIADAEPSISFFQKAIPIVSWTGSLNGKRDIFFSYREETGWSPAINISRDSYRSGNSVLLSTDKAIVLQWKDQERIHLKSLSFYKLRNLTEYPFQKTMKLKSMSHLQKNKFIGFGDSITYGWENGIPIPEEGYVPRLQDLLEDIFFEPIVTNRGVPGEPTWEAISRITSVITSDLALYLLLMEGTNDVTTLSFSMDTTIFNLREMLKQCLQYDVFPLLSTITPRAGHRWKTIIEERTRELNGKIELLSSELGILMVDSFNVFNNYPDSLGGLRSLIADPDNLHPNKKGYQVLAQAWFEKIKLIPFPPDNIEAVKKERAGEIYLNWQENPKIINDTNLINYRIYRKTPNQSDYILKGTVSSAIFSFSDTNISSGQEYLYAIAATNANFIEGPLSDPVIPVRGEPFPPINVQSNLKINKAFLYREYINRITWSESEQNQGLFNLSIYRIYRKNLGEGDQAFQLIGEVNVNQLSFLDRNIGSSAEAENYIYGISSVDENDNESLIATE